MEEEQAGLQDGGCTRERGGTRDRKTALQGAGISTSQPGESAARDLELALATTFKVATRSLKPASVYPWVVNKGNLIFGAAENLQVLA